MRSVTVSLLVTLPALLRDRSALQLEILGCDINSKSWNGHAPSTCGSPDPTGCSGFGCHAWRDTIGDVVKPETVLGWHRRGTACSRWKSRHRPGDLRFLEPPHADSHDVGNKSA
jgi:hypothetical protein